MKKDPIDEFSELRIEAYKEKRKTKNKQKSFRNTRRAARNTQDY